MSPWCRFAGQATQLECLARRERCPAHGQTSELCSITGGLEPGLGVLETARQEVWEEAGYRVQARALLPLGQVRPAKSADTVVHLFAVEVTGQEQEPPPGDGSALERDASVQWVSYE